MKKIILGLFLLTILFPLVSAQFNDDRNINQEQLDSINFGTVDLRYEWSTVRLDWDDGFRLWTEIRMATAIKIDDFYGEGQDGYRIGQKSFILEYTRRDFFSCFFQGNPPLQCFENYVESDWDIGINTNDFTHRRYLRSLQTGGDPIISRGLRDFYL